MSNYNGYIASLAQKNRDVVFYNSGPEHAAFVMGTMFMKAKESVRVLAKDFSGKVSGSPFYINALNDFLKRGGSIQILLEKYDPLNKPAIFQTLVPHYMRDNNCVSIKQRKQKVFKNNPPIEVNFATADEKMYRLEDDIEAFTASGNFNDPNSTRKLNEIFTEIFSDSESTIIPLI